MTSKSLAIAATVLLTATLGLASHGCLDVVVIRVEERDGGAGDGGPFPGLDVNDDGPRPCEVCMRAASDPGPGCADSMAACATDAPCGATMECSIAARCFELTGQGLIVDCGTPCGRDAGLDLSSPSITYVLAVIKCAQEVCGTICRGEEPPPSSRAR
jgi:hypothetical protein